MSSTNSNMEESHIRAANPPNPTFHLEQLRNPFHSMDHSSPYDSPALGNASDAYERHVHITFNRLHYLSEVKTNWDDPRDEAYGFPSSARRNFRDLSNLLDRRMWAWNQAMVRQTKIDTTNAKEYDQRKDAFQKRFDEMIRANGFSMSDGYSFEVRLATLAKNTTAFEDDESDKESIDSETVMEDTDTDTDMDDDNDEDHFHLYAAEDQATSSAMEVDGPVTPATSPKSSNQPTPAEQIQADIEAWESMVRTCRQEVFDELKHQPVRQRLQRQASEGDDDGETEDTIQQRYNASISSLFLRMLYARLTESDEDPLRYVCKADEPRRATRGGPTEVCFVGRIRKMVEPRLDVYECMVWRVWGEEPRWLELKFRLDDRDWRNLREKREIEREMWEVLVENLEQVGREAGFDEYLWG